MVMPARVLLARLTRSGSAVRCACWLAGAAAAAVPARAQAPAPVSPATPPADAAAATPAPTTAPSGDPSVPASASTSGTPSLTQSIARPARQAEGISAELRAYGLHLFNTDLDNAGDVGLTRVGAAVGVDVPVAQGTLGVSLGARVDAYDFGAGALSNPLALGPLPLTDPWEDIRTYDLGVSYGGQLSQQWGYRVGAFASSSGESGAEFSETLQAGGFVSFSYAASRDFVVGLGAGYTTQLEDDGTFIPVPFIRWKISDKWLLSTDRTTSLGGISLTYQATDSLRVGVTAGFDRANFRLSEDNARVSEGVGRHSMIPVLATLAWDATPQLTISGFAGAALWQELQLDDRDGNELIEDNAGVAPIVGLSATFRF